jgi:ATP-dependent DNA ligase
MQKAQRSATTKRVRHSSLERVKGATIKAKLSANGLANRKRRLRDLPLSVPYAPMEALLVGEIPSGDGWLYEPKWDGFRCLVFRTGDTVQLQSKSGQPLARYFPELADAVRALPADRFVLDGEIVVPFKGRLSFDQLLLRIHPAESRIQKLAAKHPAMLIVFDLLVDTGGESLVALPLVRRRKRLERFANKVLPWNSQIRLSTATVDRKQAARWLRAAGANVDGVIAKRLDLPYASGERTAMQKIKRIRSADCVVGGFRYASNEKIVGSLLLGLYDNEGLLNHVGFTANLSRTERARLTPKLEILVAQPGFTGKAPGGPSRWSTKRSTEWQPLKPRLVVEVEYDHFSGGRFRHGTSFLRWRPDKAPRQCTIDQVAQRGQKYAGLLVNGKSRDPDTTHP